jgi:hypothetical protein
MDFAAAWHEVFQSWPAGVPRRGVVVTTLNEQIPFAEFLITPVLLLLDRAAPDSMGARKVIVPFGQIAAVKITEVVKNSAFAGLGFQAAKPAAPAAAPVVAPAPANHAAPAVSPAVSSPGAPAAIAPRVVAAPV